MTTTESPFTLRTDGSISLPDIDGEPTYHLTPVLAEALVDFINENRRAITEKVQRQRTVRGYEEVARLIGTGLPVPTGLRPRWDGRVEVDLHDAAKFAEWFDAIDGMDDIDTHPTLGTRTTKTSSCLHIEGPWDRVPTDADEVTA